MVTNCEVVVRLFSSRMTEITTYLGFHKCLTMYFVTCRPNHVHSFKPKPVAGKITLEKKGSVGKKEVEKYNDSF